MAKIIAFGHKKRTGKDTAANELCRELQNVVGYSKVKTVAFADPLYGICNQLYGWDGFRSKEEYDLGAADKTVVLPNIGKTPRQLLIDLGMAVRERVHESTWVDFTIRRADAQIIIISDMRFPNEFQAVKDAGGLCIRIDRPSVAVTDDVADCALDGESRWDSIIVNDGTLNRLNFSVYQAVKDYLGVPVTFTA